MTENYCKLIATEIWRSGFIQDKNKIRQQARENMRRLVAYNIMSALKKDNPDFDIDQFLIDCRIS